MIRVGILMIARRWNNDQSWDFDVRAVSVDNQDSDFHAWTIWTAQPLNHSTAQPPNRWDAELLILIWITIPSGLYFWFSFGLLYPQRSTSGGLLYPQGSASERLLYPQGPTSGGLLYPGGYASGNTTRRSLLFVFGNTTRRGLLLVLVPPRGEVSYSCLVRGFPSRPHRIPISAT